MYRRRRDGRMERNRIRERISTIEKVTNGGRLIIEERQKESKEEKLDV